MGVIFRDHLGQLLAAATFLDINCCQPQVVESLAFKWSIQVANQLLLPHVVYETDCQDLTQAWCMPNYHNCTYYVVILQDCRQMLANSPHTLLIHTKRVANSVAHTLSRLAFANFERY